MLVLAPHGRDAEVAAALLREAGLAACICASLAELQAGLDDETVFALLTEESVMFADLRPLSARLRAQAPWSDLPVIILTRHGGGLERHARARTQSEMFGNVTFLERPFHSATFLSVARMALGSRLRQYEARARLRELHESEERLRRLNETLEERVIARTADLEAAHRAVLAEIAQREKAEAKLRQSQKMDTLGQLTGGVAHDFNNLLTVVLSSLELLRKSISLDVRATQLLDAASEGAKRGAALTQRLLAFAHQQDLKTEPRDLGEIVRGMAPLIERSIGSGIELAIELADALPCVMVDTNQIELALLNLVINARDAMPEGGSLAIRLAPAVGGREIDLPPGDFVLVTITDTGHGMDAATLQRATEPFFSTKDVGKGTGLGLSMVHGLVAQLGGVLRLASERGRGTRVDLYLPAVAAPSHPEAAIPASAPQAAAAKATILLVDDDVLVAMTTAAMLQDLGHEVIETHSGSEALALLHEGRAIDLLMTDYSMPKMNGADLARAARALRGDLPVLLATGYAEVSKHREADLPRIGKPFRQEQLAAEIGRLLEG